MTIRIQKKTLFIILGVLAALTIGASLWFLQPSEIEYEGINMKPSSNIATNLRTSELTYSFNAKLISAQYTSMLEEEGPFTVFAPTEEAYDNLPQETREALSGTQYDDFVHHALSYHIVQGEYSLSDLKEGMKLKTLEGSELTFTREGDYWVINGYSYIEMGDAYSNNGVIHLVTNYLIPESFVTK